MNSCGIPWFHVKQFTSYTQKIGLLGEDVAARFLTDKGFIIVERNYTKKTGEIDIVAQKHGIIHFVEVKTLINDEAYHPFQNITPYKLRKFSRTIEWFLAERHVSRETKFIIDIIAISVSRETRTAKVEVLWNVVPG